MQRSLELLEIAQHSQDTGYQAEALQIAGNSQRELGEYQASLLSFKQMLALPHDPQYEKTLRGWAHNGIGAAYICLGKNAKAVESLEKYLHIAQQLDDKPGQGRAYGNLGSAHFGLGQYKAAIEFYGKYLDISEQLGDRFGQGAAFGNLGNSHDGLGQHKTAIKYHHKHLDISTELNDKPGQGKAYVNLGNAYNGLGQHHTAIEYYRKHLDIAQQLGDKPGQGAAYGNLGATYDSINQNQTAIAYHQKFLDIARQLGDRPGQGRVHSNFGSVYEKMGQHEKAIENFQKHLDISIELDDKPGQRLAHGNLGVALARSGQLTSACSHFASCDALARHLEAQLAKGRWRRYLLSFGEQVDYFMDAWVVAAARLGDMVEALRIEEQHRCRSELAYQVDARGRAGGTDAELSVDEIKAVATHAGASFVIVMKMYHGALLTWVLSGKTGELVYGKIVDIKEEHQAEIAKWVKCVTFSEWGRWQDTLRKAMDGLLGIRKEFQETNSINMLRVVELIQSAIPDDMKGDLDQGLWTSIRNPDMLPATASGMGPTFIDLRRHFFQKAEKALDQLSKALWEPIVGECQLLSDFLKGGLRCCTKPVRAVRYYYYCYYHSFKEFFLAVVPLIVAQVLFDLAFLSFPLLADLFSTRPRAVAHPVLCS